MNLLSIVLKSLKQRSLSTLLTIISVALGAALVIAVHILQDETERSYRQTSTGIDLILAAPGSQLQSTLNSLYHLETSTGIIPWDVYLAAINDPRVEKAFPFYVGDNYRGHRVVGTSVDFLKQFNPREEQNFSVSEGRFFENHGEAVIGHQVAQSRGMDVGDTFFFTHGVHEADSGAEAHVHDDYPVTIVGILSPTATAHDRVIFTSVLTTDAVHNHDSPIHGHHHHNHGDDHSHDHDHNGHNGHHHEDEESFHEKNFSIPAVDAVLLKMNNASAAVNLQGMINYPTPQNPMILANMRRDPFFAYKDDMMAVNPALQVRNLMQIVGNAERILRAISLLVLIVALAGVLVALYNTMEERRRDISIMRSLGARRRTILSLILLEAFTITLIGCVLGLLGGHFIVSAAADQIAVSAGIFVEAFRFNAGQFQILGVFLGLGILAGLIPALKAYRTDVASGL